MEDGRQYRSLPGWRMEDNTGVSLSGGWKTIQESPWVEGGRQYRSLPEWRMEDNTGVSLDGGWKTIQESP